MLLLGGLAYLWRTGYINENTVDQLRDRVTNLIEGERSTADEAEKEGAEEMETVEPETELVPENEVDEVVTTTTPAAVIDAVVPAAKPAHAE